MATRRFLRALALAGGLGLMLPAVSAWASPPWRGLPPEERQQMRQQMREHWQQMPPEQREAWREQRRERWQQMPPDERQRIREEMREHRRERREFRDDSPGWRSDR